MLKYPITPEYLQKAPNKVVALYAELEDKIITDLCSRLQMSNGEITGTAVKRLLALRRRGYDMNEIIKAITQTTGIAEKNVIEALNDVISKSNGYYTGLYNATGTDLDYSFLDQEVNEIKRQTLGRFVNLSNTLGFTIRKLDGTVEWTPLNKVYATVIDQAIMQAESGMSYNECIRSAVNQLTNSGITTVEYANENGIRKQHRNKVDVAARRNVMTAITQISNKYAEQAADDLKTPYVETTAHAGARDKDGPLGWENHEKWQGKVYSYYSGDKYPSFYEKCGYGDVQGIGGANCRHSFYAFVEGVSQRTYSDADLERLKKKVTYNGKTMSQYEASQYMRKAETKLRDLKRKMLGESASGDEESYLKHAAKYKAIKSEYKDFVKQTGLRNQLDDRAFVIGWGAKEAREAQLALMKAAEQK